jgi:hypothetical protein
MERATAFSIAGALRNPVNFWAPARLLSLHCRRWFSCTVRHFGGPLWITHRAEVIRSEMSGSPIVFLRKPIEIRALRVSRWVYPADHMSLMNLLFSAKNGDFPIRATGNSPKPPTITH